MPAQDLILDLAIRYGFQVVGAIAILVPHGSDLTAVLAMVREVVAANPRVLADPVAVVGVAQLELAGVRVGAHPWVRVPDVVAAEAELYQALADRFAAGGISVPMPKQEVRVLMSS